MGVPQRRLKFTLFHQNFPQRAPAACPKLAQQHGKCGGDTSQKNQTVIKLLARPRNRRGGGDQICLIHAFFIACIGYSATGERNGKSGRGVTPGPLAHFF